MKSTTGVLQDKASEFCSKNSMLHANNEMLQAMKKILVQWLIKIKLEQKELQGKVCDKDEMARAGLEVGINTLRERPNTDRYADELDRTFVALMTPVDTHHEI
ncbi:hypothetical protein FXO37_00228 [Capsicum annuum]|nr:hypothetical protein FXO37_00228 [Capsicum annuum]